MSSNSQDSKSTDPARRSSQGGGLFGNLASYKREGQAYEARRQSITEQSASKPGIFGNMFNNVFKGPSAASPPKESK